jgi:oligoribonuclease NrnB/cAMP/cGMP phosphodiesterase (DHH superfamily)
MRPTARTALITHRGCLDGTGSALVFIWAGGRRDRIKFKNPSGLILVEGDLEPDVDEAWYADCCPPDMADPALGRPFMVFDHHVSNERLFSGDERCVFDMSRSGTSLMAHVLGQVDDSDTFEMEGRRDLIAALEAYDLGRFSYEPGQRLADIAASYSQEEMLQMMLELGPHGSLHDRDLTCRAEAMAAIRKLYADSAAKSADFASLSLPLGDFRIGVATSPPYWKNEVSERILDSGKADVAVVIDPSGGSISLRSRTGGPDCSHIAELYGGGGHARASGFKASAAGMLEALTQRVFG